MFALVMLKIMEVCRCTTHWKIMKVSLDLTYFEVCSNVGIDSRTVQCGRQLASRCNLLLFFPSKATHATTVKLAQGLINGDITSRCMNLFTTTIHKLWIMIFFCAYKNYRILIHLALRRPLTTLPMSTVF
jgi:hypothetical protein